MYKRDLMEPLADEIRICRNCGLWRQRKNAVPGEGSLDAAVMLIGEVPGYWEDVKGRPFVGAAGKILDEVVPFREYFWCRCCHASLRARKSLCT